MAAVSTAYSSSSSVCYFSSIWIANKESSIKVLKNKVTCVPFSDAFPRGRSRRMQRAY